MATETTKTLTRDLPNGSRIVATLAISDHGSGPYFSLTGDLYERHGTWSGAARQRNGREPDGCGMMHAEVLRAFPHLAPFARMHLADAETGEPMHAIANGWYFYSGGAEEHERRHYGDDYARRHGTGYERACRALRVDAIPPDLERDEFERFAFCQRPRWAEEAAAARAIVAGGPVWQTDHSPGVVTDERGVREWIANEPPPAGGWATCGTCGRTWDDDHPTGWTPAPSGRCPFEYDHDHEED